MIDYEFKRTKERIGGLDFEIECLADLDRTIDQICEMLPLDPFAEDLCPYFGVMWPAARALAEHVAKMGTWLNGKTVLELGCGLALPSLVAAKLGAKVTATDFHPDVPKFLERNLKLNNMHVEYVNMNWREEKTSLGTFDFVIASDVLYENRHAEEIADAFVRHCHKTTAILMADPGRSYLQRFTDAMKERKFRHEMLIRSVPENLKSGGLKDVFILSFQRL